MSRNSENATKQEVEHRLKIYREQLEELREMNTSYRVICHDMKYHMCLLADYIRNQENQRALDYMEKLNVRLGECGKCIDTGNIGIDSILNRKIREIKDKGGEVTVDIKIKERLQVDDLDMNIILGNLLSNVCEAIEENKNQNNRVTILMRYDRGVFKIKISNLYSSEIKEEYGHPVTRKADKQNHGIGLRSVRRTVNKYHGDLNVTYDEKEVSVVVILYV